MSGAISRRSFLTAAAGLVAAGATSARAAPSSSPARGGFDLERFVDDVKRANAETDRQRAVREVLRRAVTHPQAVLAELGEPGQVGLKSLYRSPDLTIHNVVWAPMMVLLPHNHNMWATIGIYTGREDNIVWQRQAGGVIEAASANSLSEKEVFALPLDAIHSVTNPIPRMTGAIHIYGGDFFAVPRSEWDSETLRERPMDIGALQKRFDEANQRFQGKT
jgi:predicted metal-dependent enzyme (double-stranded beta helix superfamily)